MTTQTFTRTLISGLAFTQLERHPGLVHLKITHEQTDGKVKAQECLVRQAVVDAAIDSGDPVAFVTGLLESRLSGEVSDASLYNLVPAAWLDQPFNETLRAWGREELALHERAQLDGYVPLHMNFYDHTIWDMAGKQVAVPVQIELWESDLDLDAVGVHLADDERVIDYEIVRNPVGQNHDISGKRLGMLTVRLTDANIAQIAEISGRSVSPDCIQSFVGNRRLSTDGDVLGLAPFRVRAAA
jgi:hypothetical protein